MGNLQKKTILLVEDEPLVALTEKAALEQCGYMLITAADGKKAIETVERSPEIDLVLMDIDLGQGIDGIETAEIILKDHDLPIVFLSGHTEPEIVEKTGTISSYGYVVKSTGISVLDASIKMAFRLFAANKKISDELKERKRIESSLSLAEKTWEKTFNSAAGMGMVTVSPGGRFLNVNRALCDMLGYTEDELKALPFQDITHPEDLEENLEHVRRMLAGETGGFRMEKRYLHKTGRVVWALLNVFLLRDKNSVPLYSISQVMDITERKMMEEELLRIKEKYQSLAEGTHAILWEYDIEQDRWTYVAPQAERILGYAPHEWKNLMFWRDHIHEDDRGWATDYCFACTARGEAHSFEYRFITRNGSIVWLRDVVNVEMDDGKAVRLRGFMVDITGLKEAGEKIQSLLEEKELLLKEVHHRMKNNMSTISSLLSIQAGIMKEPVAAGALEEASNRVKSMMLLYEKLYGSSEFTRMPVRTYLPALVDEVVANFPNSRIVRIEKNIDDFVLESEILQPIGIIINELLTNTMKYAFAGRDKGTISVSVTLRGELVTIIIQDDGIGLPEGFDAGGQDGFGLTLVRMLSEQLDGSFTMENRSGTRSTVEFPLRP